MLKALWGYRDFVWGSVLREFSGRYREALLCAFLALALPLSMILVDTVIFGRLFDSEGRLPKAQLADTKRSTTISRVRQLHSRSATDEG